jgi:uncharacterized protein
MNAFDMISEPVLFAEQLCEHSHRVHQCVELIPALADALLAQDDEKMRILHQQISKIRDEVGQSKLSLYDQIKNMHFHSVGGCDFGQYLACQDKVASSAQEFADLLVSRKTTIPIELHADLRALVAQVVNLSGRTRSLMGGFCSEAQGVRADTEAQNMPDAIRGIIDENGQARRLKREFARRVYSLEKQLDPVTILFLDRCCGALHEVADGTEQTAEHLRLMIR